MLISIRSIQNLSSMSIKFNYAGKVVLVTGSSSGIGAATALMFARSGAQVVVTGLNEERVTAVAEQCRRFVGKGIGVVADVTKEYEMVRLVDITIKEFGRLNILVNNAGYFGAAAISSQDYVKTCRQLMDTNLFSAIQLTHLCLPHLTKTKGVVVNVSSIAAKISVWP